MTAAGLIDSVAACLPPLIQACEFATTRAFYTRYHATAWLFGECFTLIEFKVFLLMLLK